MARKPMVTRTITTTKVNALCLEVVKCEPCNKVVSLSGTFKDEKSTLKATKELLETDNLKVVHIVDTEEIETLYGMSEQDFVEKAEILDPTTRKPLEKETEETEETEPTKKQKKEVKTK